MGDSRFDASQWQAHASAVSNQSQAQIFTQNQVGEIHKGLDPKNIKVRESVDSDSNPESTPVALFVDVTGSMGHLAENIVKKGLGVIMTEIYERKPISDPHILCGAIGDANGDRAPLQVTQFEAGVQPITEQVSNIWIEGQGMGNGGESYMFAWWFIANKTSCDAISKRHRKGYLFTIGDEAPHRTLTRAQIKQYTGEDVESDVSIKDLLDEISQNWEVFHLITPTGATSDQDATRKWKDLLGERAITVDDYEKLSEVIVSTIQVIEGEDAQKVADSWDGSTSIVVQKAIKGLSKSKGKGKADELVRL